MLKKRLGLNAIELNWWSTENLTDYFKIPSSLTIPERCERIGKCAFWGCLNIEKVIIPNSVETIGGCAFWECSSLEEIEIPESVMEIRDSAFSGCGRLKKVEIPESVDWIRYGAFWGCYDATIILKKPEREFKEIGAEAFWMCKDVKEEIRN